MRWNAKLDTRVLVLPTLCAGGAALLVSPSRESHAFSKIGGALGETQRDVRVFDNFHDPTANDNVSPPPQFPGWSGVELAVWKGIAEWGSRLHGDGTGEPQSANLIGNAGANFDGLWSGNTSGIGTANDNIVSSLQSCGGGGTLAYTETPIANGWRIRFCDEWLWDDGPGVIAGGHFDVQGVMAHEYGHALGLGHSSTGSATMAPSVNAASTRCRSIEADDIAGVQCIYGVASPTKPVITATVADAGATTLTILGSQFGATDNEVWFTPAAASASDSDPIVRVTGVSSSAGNTLITVSIPADAGPGDVMVNKSGVGGATLSNAFPTDLVGTFGAPPGVHPGLTTVVPATIAALIPGTAQTIVLTGTALDLATAVLLDGIAISPSRYTIVDPSTITLDMPQAASLGLHALGVSDGVVTLTLPVTIVAPATPTYELGTGDPLNVVDRDDGLQFILSGAVGSTQRVLPSPSNLPSSHAFISLAIGNNFTSLLASKDFVIPAAGWLQVNVPASSLLDPGPAGRTFYSQTFEIALPLPLEVSNLQSIVLVR